MKAPTTAYPQNITLGVFLIVSAALAISIQDVVFKLFSSELTLWQIFSLRGMVAVPALLMVGRIRGTHHSDVRAALGSWPMLRSVFITTTFLAFYAALPFLSLSTVGASNYIAPIFVTLLSAFVIKESVGLFGWIGVFIGFLGVVVLLQPGTDAFSPWALLPIMGAAFYALAHMTTRTKCQGVSLAAMTLSLNIVMLVAGLVISGVLFWFRPQGDLVEACPYIFGQWFEVSRWDWLIIIVLAGFALGIGMLLAGAYQVAPPSIVSTFEYSYLVFVAVWDILFFGIALSATSIIGMVLIIVAGLLVLRRKPPST